MLVQEGSQIDHHLAGQKAKRFRRRTGISLLVKRPELLTLQLPEPGAEGGNGGAELTLNRTNPLQASDPDFVRPAATRFGVAEGAGRIPSVSLRQRPSHKVTAGQDRFQRLVHGVERDELPRLVCRTGIEFRRERFWIRTLVIGPRHER